MEIRIIIDKSNKYLLSYKTDKGFFIYGFDRKEDCEFAYRQANKEFGNTIISEIKGQVIIENLFFDYMSKFRGKI